MKATQKSVVAAILVKSKERKSIMNNLESSNDFEKSFGSNQVALALIDILYAQGTIDYELYRSIQAKSKLFVKADNA